MEKDKDAELKPRWENQDGPAVVNQNYFNTLREKVDALKAEWPGLAGLDALPLAVDVAKDKSCKAKFPDYRPGNT